MLTDKCLELLDKDDLKRNSGSKEFVVARAKAVKGLVELVNGNLESGEAKDFVLVLVHCFVVCLIYLRTEC